MLRKKIIALSAIVLGLASCSEWLDVNIDPTKPSTVPNKTLLSGAQASLSTQFGGQYQIRGALWAQHCTQSNGANQYKSEERYDVTSSTLNSEYLRLMSGGLYDLKKLEEKAAATGNNSLLLISTVLQAYSFQYLSDLYEEVPYSQALKGDLGIVKPKFDHGKEIYADLIARLERVVVADFSGPNNENFGANDLIFYGDVSKWIAFANTLKLRLAIRQHKVVPQVLNAIDLENTSFLTEDAKITAYSSESGRNNPLYSSEYIGLGGANLRASNTLLHFLQDNSDPRLSKIYDASANAGVYLGLDQGDFDKPSTAILPAALSKLVVKNSDPVYFMVESESYFLQAEAYLIKGNATKAEEFYRKGVKASFDRFNVGQVENFVDEGKPYNYNGLESIITQKWISMVQAQGMEAFFEFNRTGYPSVFTVSKTGKLVKDGVPQFLRRLRFPEYELTSNKVNVPTQKEPYINLWWAN